MIKIRKMSNIKTSQHSISGSESDHSPQPTSMQAPNGHTTQLATRITSSRPRTDHLPVHNQSRSSTPTVNARAVTAVYKYTLLHGWSWDGTRGGRDPGW